MLKLEEDQLMFPFAKTNDRKSDEVGDAFRKMKNQEGKSLK